MRIVIETIPHQNQRYDTCGDWFWDREEKTLYIFVSETGDWKKNFLIARHELDEAMLCKFRGVTAAQVDEYDLAHPEAGSDSFSDNTDAPYSNSHNDALAAEWIMSRLLGVDWVEYTKTLDNMEYTHEISPQQHVRGRSSDSVEVKARGT
jgi:hypothetical protein